MYRPSVAAAIKKLRCLLTREEKWTWVFIVLFAVAISILEVFSASSLILFVKILNDQSFCEEKLSKIGLEISYNGAIFYTALACGVIYVVKSLVAAAEIFFQNLSIQKMNFRFKDKLLNKYASADYSFFLHRNSVDCSSIINIDVEEMFRPGLVSLSSVVSEGIVFFVLTLLIVAMNPSLAFILFVVVTVMALLINKWLLPSFFDFGKKIQDSKTKIASSANQFFRAIKEVLLFGKSGFFIDAYNEHSMSYSRVNAATNAFQSMPRIIIEVLFMAIFVITILFMCVQHISPAKMVETLSLYLYAGFRMMPALNRGIASLNMFKGAIPHIERVYEEFCVLIPSKIEQDVPEFSFKSSLSITNVTYTYHNSNVPILDNVSLNISRGQYIGIIGESGAGKSTLIDILIGLLKPDTGSVLIDGKFDANTNQWSKKIGYVAQTPYLTDDTIATNIAFGESQSSLNIEKLNRIIKAVQLESFINNLPKGVYTEIGECGVRLSGGERQRISIARALYLEPDVLVFDEATSSLDNKTEAALMETIYSLSREKTVIMVAHRLSTLEKCDRILELKSGKIIEREKKSVFN